MARVAGCSVSVQGRAVCVSDPEHKAEGDPCSKCGLPARRHRKRKRTARNKVARRRKPKELRVIVGIDGEGRGRDPHVYTYLSAVDEWGCKLGSVERQDGLSTEECLDFLLSLGHSTLFGFSLGYDLAMMLRDLPDERLYELAHEKCRERTHRESGRNYLQAVYWRGFKLNLMRRRFSVQRVAYDKASKRYVPRSKSVVVWDVFQFYQGRFTKALGDWKTAPQEVIDEIQRMKDRRDDFDNLPAADIQKYCDNECELLARLVRQLVDACKDADLELEGFWGAGAVASATLHKLGVKEYMADPPAEMRRALACGFFGGRFELSRVGEVAQPCWGHDISSAYPYQQVQLPCLVCGRWRFVSGPETDKRVRNAQLALVHCEVRRSGPAAWGPLPWRRADGAILFPLRCAGTWVWADEYLAAKDTLWPGVEARSAWVYETQCAHRPFAGLTDLYNYRLQIGKDGPGIIVKLGVNAGYGKTAQAEGSAPFQSWAYAGQTTSATRAQLLHAIAAAKDPANVLMLATDGVLATERLRLPGPIETGTGSTPDRDSGKLKPLGGWEIKSLPSGVFLCRPGIYFPLDLQSADQLKELRARGISRSVLVEHADRIIEHFKKHGPAKPYSVTKILKNGREVEPCVRFIGLRQGIRLGAGMDTSVGEHKHRFPNGPECAVCGVAVVRDPVRYDEHGDVVGGFGTWANHPVDVTFKPDPKRAEVRRDFKLTCWENMPLESTPYDRADASDPETLALREEEEMRADQADGDVCLR